MLNFGLHAPEIYLSDTIDPPPLLNKSCGNSVAEARQAGCVFDILTTAWTPADCVNSGITEEFLNISTNGVWPYYHDKNGKFPQKDIAILKSGEWEGELWSTMRLHRYHCLFTWRRMHIAYNGGQPADTVIRGLRHTKHCEKMLMNGVDPDKVTGVQSVYYRSC
ncbi:hypothetical protein J3E72DRAFT_231568 [Bipolaris maydis]|nr:hypothetical protein J3E74DRAFT_284136 [Bipolaris maydis]KAJ5055176.1 hypothetical protein J3E74DRAFT_282025 [Bipolaris maydis]KAJ6203049.1 hypothetical protein J3E72DRAFT_231568 [Bipolaris maydis]